MKTITFKLESEEKEFAFSVDLTNESFEKVKHILLKNIEQSVLALLGDNVESINRTSFKEIYKKGDELCQR